MHLISPDGSEFELSIVGYESASPITNWFASMP